MLIVSRPAAGRTDSALRIRLIDFGSAVRPSDKHNPVIGTPEYRSPEAILQAGWSYPTDIWSLGCILAELHIGHVLFPLVSEELHLELMARLLGRPLPASLIARGFANLNQHNRPLLAVDRFGAPQLKPCAKPERAAGFPRLEHAVSDPSLAALLRGLLEPDPALRLSAKATGRHGYLTALPAQLPATEAATTDQPQQALKPALPPKLPEAANGHGLAAGTPSRHAAAALGGPFPGPRPGGRPQQKMALHSANGDLLEEVMDDDSDNDVLALLDDKVPPTPPPPPNVPATNLSAPQSRAVAARWPGAAQTGPTMQAATQHSAQSPPPGLAAAPPSPPSAASGPPQPAATAVTVRPGFDVPAEALRAQLAQKQRLVDFLLDKHAAELGELRVTAASTLRDLADRQARLEKRVQDTVPREEHEALVSKLASLVSELRRRLAALASAPAPAPDPDPQLRREVEVLGPQLRVERDKLSRVASDLTDAQRRHREAGAAVMANREEAEGLRRRLAEEQARSARLEAGTEELQRILADSVPRAHFEREIEALRSRVQAESADAARQAAAAAMGEAQRLLRRAQEQHEADFAGVRMRFHEDLANLGALLSEAEEDASGGGSREVANDVHSLMARVRALAARVRQPLAWERDEEVSRLRRRVLAMAERIHGLEQEAIELRAALDAARAYVQAERSAPRGWPAPSMEVAGGQQGQGRWPPVPWAGEEERAQQQMRAALLARRMGSLASAGSSAPGETLSL